MFRRGSPYPGQHFAAASRLIAVAHDTIGVGEAHRSRTGAEPSPVDVQIGFAGDYDKVVPTVMRTSIGRRIAIPAVAPGEIREVIGLRFEDPAEWVSFRGAVIGVARPRPNHRVDLAEPLTEFKC